MSQETQLPPDDLIRRTRGDVAFVVNFSGGKDSLRMLGRVRELYPNHPIFVVMADTGFEHVRPISAEDWSRKQVARYELPLTVVRNPNKTYLQMVEWRGMFPSSTTRQCTSDLKRGPIEKFVRALSQKVIVNCTGIRSEESSQRSKQISWKANSRLPEELYGTGCHFLMRRWRKYSPGIGSLEHRFILFMCRSFTGTERQAVTSNGFPADSASSQPQQIWWRLSRATPKHLSS